MSVKQQIRKKAFNYICRDVCWEGLPLSECRKEKCDLYQFAVKLDDVLAVVEAQQSSLRELIEKFPEAESGCDCCEVYHEWKEALVKLVDT